MSKKVKSGIPATYVPDLGIPAAERKKIVDGLSRPLADADCLYLTTRNFHWNVTFF